MFGDGTVVMKLAPGHSPGHQVLFLKLKQTGPVVLSGDLYHYPEERKLKRVPTFEWNQQVTVGDARENRGVSEAIRRAALDPARLHRELEAKESPAVLRIEHMRWALAFLAAGAALAQTHPRFQAQSPASVTYSEKDGQQAVEITNIAYEVTGTAVPGRPPDQRLLLRTTTRTKQMVDDIGMEAATTVEAWPLGVDPKQKPIYSLKVAGMDCKTVDGALLVVLRGLEDTEWWSVYKLGSGERLFDTYTPLLGFSIRRDIQTMRYAGFEDPPDDIADARLKNPHVVGVLTYASPERVLREALITSDDPKQAQMLRSFDEASRTVTLIEAPARALKIAISQNYPSAPATVAFTIPIVRDDLDLAHALMPAHLHAASFQR